MEGDKKSICMRHKGKRRKAEEKREQKEEKKCAGGGDEIERNEKT